MDVGAWLVGLGLGRYAQAFRDNEIDGDILSTLTPEDLKDLGVSVVGHRRRLLNAIEFLRAEAGNVDSESVPSPRGAAQRPAPSARVETAQHFEAERRQLTVLFCDLVGSTALSARLDPEDMREVIRTFQDTCAGVIARFEGFVARFMGDGVLAYFGYPRGFEDAAERAVKAGLALRDAITRQPSPLGDPLAARVGIATGVVVVGDLIGEGASREQPVVGETPNLAARLQSLAEPGGVVIAESTRRLVGKTFELQDFGRHELKGFDEPATAWWVAKERMIESRFEAAGRAALIHFVGREHELGLLLERWELAKAGEGQTVLIAGEPGVGKSRITQRLREHIGGEPHTRLCYQCSPLHINSALHPVIAQLEFAAGFASDDTPERKLDKLKVLLARSAESVEEVAPIFAALLSLPSDDRYAPLSLTPQRLKERTLGALVDQLVGLSARDPVLMIFEDVHWIDPTTQELMGLVVDRIQALGVLAIVTFRPEFTPPWAGHSHISTLALNRLGRQHCVAMVSELTGGKTLPDEVLDQIVAKTDGVPLFVEELTKTVLESGLLEDGGDRYLLSGPLPSVAIPASLQDSLMARLDRLASVKEVAQIGAVIGRQFSYELLAAVAQPRGGELREALAHLVNSQLVSRAGTLPRATYTFKHALVRDAAYESLLHSRRRQLHARIADVLRERFPDVAETEPELLAHHYIRAEALVSAIDYLERAGKRAIARSANWEAIGHLKRALDSIDRLPVNSDHDALELRLQLILGPALMATHGWSAPEVRCTYERAQALCRGTEEIQSLFQATWGMWMHYQARSDHRHGRELTKDLLTLAERSGDTGLQLQSHHATWTTCLYTGELESAIAHCRRGLALYDIETHADHAFAFAGHDPGVCGKAQGGNMLWLLGYPEQATASCEAAIELALRLGHQPSLAHAYLFAARLYSMQRNIADTDRCAQACIELAEQLELPLYLGSAQILKGWVAAVDTGAGEGLMQIEAGFVARQGIQALSAATQYMGLGADALLHSEELQRAERTIADALGIVEATGERLWEAELYRLHGEIHCRVAPKKEQLALAALGRALDISRSQKARSLELRAAVSLARFWRERSRTVEARNLLAPIYDWFTEGFDTHDLKDAKVLLSELT